MMYDPFLELPEGKPYRLKDGFNVAFLATFAPDEPVDEVLAAAARLPDVTETGGPVIQFHAVLQSKANRLLDEIDEYSMKTAHLLPSRGREEKEAQLSRARASEKPPPGRSSTRMWTCSRFMAVLLSCGMRDEETCGLRSLMTGGLGPGTRLCSYACLTTNH